MFEHMIVPTAIATLAQICGIAIVILPFAGESFDLERRTAEQPRLRGKPGVGRM